MEDIAKAIVQAQANAERVGKDGRNAHHKYDYASAEAILTVASTALTDAGLALVPKSTTSRADEGGRMMVREYLLVHESGQTMEMKQEWPIVPDRGRPMDKAVAAGLKAENACPPAAYAS